MKIGIIVYSQSGNTHSVAEKIAGNLSTENNTVIYERITIEKGKTSNPKDFKFSLMPNTDNYDAIVFGAPVHAFSLCAVMKEYLNKIGDLKGKKVFCYTTHHFPFPILGGKQAINTMKKLCKSKNANIIGEGIIDWSKKDRESQIENLISSIKDSFK